MLLCIAAGYFILARISLLLSFQSSNATPLWPPSGLAFALILYYGLSIAPAILVGAFAANVVVFQLNNAADITTEIWISALISIGNTAEAAVGLLLLRKILPLASVDNYFNKVKHIFWFVVVVVIMCLVASIVGTGAVYTGAVIEDNQYFRTWLTWWLGDVSGIILFTPVIVAWINFFRNRATSSTPQASQYAIWSEKLILFLLIVFASGIVFGNWFLMHLVFRWAFWVFPVVVWAAVRFKQHEATTALLVCALISIWGTINGHGPFSNVSQGDADIALNDSLLILQAFTCIVTVSALVLNASVNERRRTEATLRTMSNELERRVEERTAELLERNRFIETLFDTIEDLMAVFDKNGNYISVNKKVEDIYDVRREDIIGKYVLDVFPSLKHSGMFNNIQKALSGENVHHIAYQSPVTNRYYENFYIPLRDARQEVYGVLVIAHDNTPIMEAAEKIRTVNTRLTEAQRLAHIGDWEWDIANDKITWSDELYRVFGLPEDSEPGFEKYMEFIHPDDKDLVSQTVLGAYTNHQPFHFYHRIVRPDGTTRYLHGRGKVYVDESGRPLSMAGTAQDVTELKQAEHEIRKITDELIRYNKELEQTNKELESFTFVASHDLQEPLRKIQTFLSFIIEKESATLSEGSVAYMERTMHAAAQMRELINDLLLYSRTTSAPEHFKNTDLNIILHNVLKELKEIIEEKQACIEVDQLPDLNVIPFQLHQFFINMLSNSLKFSREGITPHIRIHAGIADPESLEHLDADVTKKYYRVTIADNGIGFDPKYNKKIFELFQRLNNRTEYMGTGIGLSICKKIVENHDGYIMASGEPGKGAIFNIYLPHRQMPEGNFAN
jgi:PAS domain S-box-containing protein